jgi:hypothetical protein
LQVSQGGVIIGTEMNDGRGIVASPSLLEYFRDVLAGAMERQRIQVAEATEFYLVNLLAEFCRADALFAPDEGGGSRDAEPLAFMLKRAQEATGFERVRELKRLGDTSLYVSGFFGDSLARKLVDIDYYIAMGGRAYSALAELFRDANLGPLYGDLADKFVPHVDLLNEVSDRAAVGTNQGLLRLYERWVRTGSRRVARLLGERGVLPSKGSGFVQ